MSVTIEYELGDGTHSITRDECHFDTDRYVTAFYNDEDEPGVTRKVQIPDSRVVMIHEDEE